MLGLCGFALLGLPGLAAADVPPWRVPFGVTLGQPIPPDLAQKAWRESLPGMDGGAFTVVHRELAPPSLPRLEPSPITPDGRATQSPVRFSVHTTPTSNTVHRVGAWYRFPDRASCMTAAHGLLIRTIDGRPTGGKGYGRQSGRMGLFEDLRVSEVFFEGDRTGAFDIAFPLVLRDPARLAQASGVRLLLACGPEGNLLVIFQHLPSVELRIAEAYQGSRTLMDLYATAADGQPLPPYMMPFGISLGRPLAQALRIGGTSPAEQPLSATNPVPSEGHYVVQPPDPHPLFWRTMAGVTPMTETVLDVTATRAIKSKAECLESMNEVIKALSARFGC